MAISNLQLIPRIWVSPAITKLRNLKPNSKKKILCNQSSTIRPNPKEPNGSSKRFTRSKTSEIEHVNRRTKTWNIGKWFLLPGFVVDSNAERKRRRASPGFFSRRCYELCEFFRGFTFDWFLFLFYFWFKRWGCFANTKSCWSLFFFFFLETI